MKFHVRISMMAGAVFLIGSVQLAVAGDQTPAAAPAPDAASQSALHETQEMLRNPQDRAKGVMLHPMGPAVDGKVHELGGTEQNTNDIYGLAADVMSNLMKQAGGDADKAMLLLLEAQKDPAGWAAKWSPEQQQQLHDLSNRLPANQAPAAATSHP